MNIINSAFGDVTGDRVPDYVYLTGIRNQESPFWQQITLMIQDGATHQLFTVQLDPSGNAGYNPTLFLGDFTKDGISDILIRIDSGGSGAFTYDYVYTFVNHQARKLFDFNLYNQQNQYNVVYQDGYKVSVTSLATNNTFIIDISGRGKEYLSQIYDESGKLKAPVQGFADGVSGFYPVDMDRDGSYELQAYQQVSGLYHADSLGYVINTLQWNGQQFVIWQQWFAIFPS